MVEAETWKWIKVLNGTIEMNKQKITKLIDSVVELKDDMAKANNRIKTMEEATVYCADKLESLESRLSSLEETINK